MEHWVNASSGRAPAVPCPQRVPSEKSHGYHSVFFALDTMLHLLPISSQPETQRSHPLHLPTPPQGWRFAFCAPTLALTLPIPLLPTPMPT